MPAILATAWKIIGPILTFGITLPVWFFLAGGVWLWVDKASAARVAVDRAVTRLVAGAELDALRETAAANARLAAFRDGEIAEARRRQGALEAANAALSGQQAANDIENKRLIDELDELASQPPPADCRVNPDLLRRLRNR
jgi:hypothetical protein